MTAKLKIILTILLASATLLAMSGATTLAAFNPLDSACTGGAANSAVCKDAAKQTVSGDNPISGTNGIISKAANIVAVVAALGAVINIIIGAFEFVTAGGTGFKSATANPAPTKAAKARSRVTSGVIGLAIVVLAWSIVRFVVDRVIT